MSGSTSSKFTVGSAWAAWAADGSPAAKSEFLHRIGSWLEGTAEQLRRGQWPAGMRRPSSSELQERLRHHLVLVVQDGTPNYLEGLDRARRGVIEEIHGSRTTPATRPSRRDR